LSSNLYIINAHDGSTQDLQASLQRLQRESAQKEDHLQAELSAMRAKYLAAEGRAQEATLAASELTQPLRKQIDAMQNTMKQRAREWYMTAPRPIS
jgi:CRISPR/Cas system CSM-associated protein Csm2 small subunit